ncbi:hypothetical protein EVAR_43808_1 [Eumeta japonica]|uniref:Uncharacterized protein n=1 Tax=Eumeta variegata TaxID=151549 RepID=A0A4C1XYE4_EUMVA|nr:hypothetical protein EVAR_43808_1 [Eumeta japonica]
MQMDGLIRFVTGVRGAAPIARRRPRSSRDPSGCTISLRKANTQIRPALSRVLYAVRAINLFAFFSAADFCHRYDRTTVHGADCISDCRKYNQRHFDGSRSTNVTLHAPFSVTYGNDPAFIARSMAGARRDGIRRSLPLIHPTLCADRTRSTRNDTSLRSRLAMRNQRSLSCIDDDTECPRIKWAASADKVPHFQNMDLSNSLRCSIWSYDLEFRWLIFLHPPIPPIISQFQPLSDYLKG